MKMIALLLCIHALARADYIFQNVCVSTFADANNLFCVSAYDDIGQAVFTFFIPTGDAGKEFAQTSKTGDALTFSAEDVTNDIDCQAVKQATTLTDAATNAGVKVAFVAQCLWSGGASRVSVRNEVAAVTVRNAFSASYFPFVDDWYDEFLLDYHSSPK